MISPIKPVSLLKLSVLLSDFSHPLSSFRKPGSHPWHSLSLAPLYPIQILSSLFPNVQSVLIVFTSLSCSCCYSKPPWSAARAWANNLQVSFPVSNLVFLHSSTHTFTRVPNLSFKPLVDFHCSWKKSKHFPGLQCLALTCPLSLTSFIPWLHRPVITFSNKRSFSPWMLCICCFLSIESLPRLFVWLSAFLSSRSD